MKPEGWHDMVKFEHLLASVVRARKVPPNNFISGIKIVLGEFSVRLDPLKNPGVSNYLAKQERPMTKN